MNIMAEENAMAEVMNLLEVEPAVATFINRYYRKKAISR